MDVDEPNVLLAWQAASRLITDGSVSYVLTLSAGPDFDLTTSALNALDRKARAAGTESPSAVANMLCPRVVAEHQGTVAEAKMAGLRLLGRGRRRGQRFSQWRHTYFERLIGTFMPANGQESVLGKDKLSTLIAKLNSWHVDVQAALYIHNSMPADTFRTRGSPCLQYIQFRPYSGNRLDLVALYRSHDYSAKALGNLIGLQRLGQFVARHSGRHYGKTQVISLNPHFSLTKGAQQHYADDII
jgi:hypothetical protein